MNGHADEHPRPWRMAVNALTAASPGLDRPGDRRRAELLAGLLLTLICLGLVAGLVQLAAVPDFFPTFLAMAAAIACLTAAYGVSRTPRYRVAAIISCLAPLAACLATLASNPEDPVALPFMVLAVLFAAVFLPTSAAILTAIVVVTLDGMIIILVPALASADRWVPAIAFHAIVSTLLVIAARQRNRVETHQDRELQRLAARWREAEDESSRLRRQLAAAQHLATVGRLTAGLGHDLNNLLALVLDLHSQVDSGDKRVASLVSQARGAGQVAIRIVRDMLSVARSPAPPKQHAVVDVNEVLKDSLALLGCATTGRCELSVRCHPGPLRSRVDALDVQRIVLNLASNAAQAMPHGGVLGIETHLAEGVTIPKNPQLARGPYAVILVEDSGGGMDGPELAQVFEPFVSSRAAEGGIGMGLAIVRELADRHGGVVEAWSERGRGTRFTVFLPLA
jgi:signal transduction histidine kinase